MFIFLPFIQNIQFTTNLRRMILMQLIAWIIKIIINYLFPGFFLSDTRSHASYSDITVFSGG